MSKHKIVFEWDEDKEQKNIRKHGLSFSTAALVFGDSYRIEFYDEENSYNEDRYVTIGMVNHVLTVIYTVRGSSYRIISARIATNEERRVYENGY